MTKNKNLQPQYPLIKRFIGSGSGEIVEGPFRDTNNVIFNERCTFGGSLLRVFQGALPLQYGPTVVIILRQFGEDSAKIDLPIAQRPEPTGPLNPALETTIHALLARRVELGIFYVVGIDPFVVEVDKLQIIKTLQHKVVE